MCAITFDRVSASSLPSMNAASVSSEGKPLCSIAVTFSTAFGRPYGVQRLRVTEVRFSLGSRKRKRQLVIRMLEQLARVRRHHTGSLERQLQFCQQLADALVQLLLIEVERACDVRDLLSIPKTHAQDELILKFHCGDGRIDRFRRVPREDRAVAAEQRRFDRRPIV